MAHLPVANRAFFLLTLLAIPSNVWAQPAPKPQPPTTRKTLQFTFEHQPVININVIVPASGELQLGLYIKNANVSDVLQQIATRGNLQIVVRNDANVQLKSLSLPAETPLGALEKVCQEAKLRYQNQDGVWVISPLDAATPQVQQEEPMIESMEFKDITIKQAVAMISEQFKVTAVFDADVDSNTKVSYLRVGKKSPRQIIDLIASVAGLKTHEDKGTLLISK